MPNVSECLRPSDAGAELLINIRVTVSRRRKRCSGERVRLQLNYEIPHHFCHWSLYSVPVTLRSVSKMYSACGMLASFLIAVVIVPGFILMLIRDEPRRDSGS